MRPLLEGGDEGFLGEVFGEADVAGDAGEAGDEARGLDAPDGFDGAVWWRDVDRQRTLLPITPAWIRQCKWAISWRLIWQFSAERYFVLDLFFGQDGGEVFRSRRSGGFRFRIRRRGGWGSA